MSDERFLLAYVSLLWRQHSEVENNVIHETRYVSFQQLQRFHECNKFIIQGESIDLRSLH